MTDLTKLTLADALDGLKAKKFSSREITQDFIRTIEGSRVLNAYVVETPEKALEMADKADERLGKGEGGKLEGAPLGVKDLYCTKGIRTTACSNILGEFTPTYESTVTQNLWTKAPLCSASSTWTNSPWGPPTRRPGSARRLTRGAARATMPA
jgi:aspartyl-tRNA(Asn)/glutamyl-tRNA(Gln) amidotransferase subunit A